MMRVLFSLLLLVLVTGLCASQDTSAPKLARLRGTVKSHDLKPVNGANVWLDPAMGELPTHGDAQVESSDARTFDQGQFVIAKAAGKYRLTVWLGARRVYVQPVALKSGEELKLDVTLPELPALRGRVVDADGQPLKQARVIVRHDKLLRSAIADDAGEFALLVPPSGKSQLSVWDGGVEVLAPRDVEINGEKPELLTLNLPPLAVVTLRVLKIDAAPLTNTKIDTRLHSWPKELVTDEDGTTTLRRLAAGEYQLLLRAGADGWAIRSFTLLNQEMQKTLDVRLQPNGAVSGQVVTVDGKPMPNVELNVSGVSPNPFNMGNALTATRSDAQGRFHLDGIWAGPFHLEIRAPDGYHKPGMWRTFWMAPGQHLRDVTIVLAPTRTTSAEVARPAPSAPATPRMVPLTGEVLDARGKPVATATINIDKLLPGSETFGIEATPGQPLTTDAQGRFRAERVTPGWHAVSARTASGLDTVTWLHVAEPPKEGVSSDPCNVVLQLPEKTGRMRGRVTIDGGRSPAAGVHVIAIDRPYQIEWDSEYAAMNLKTTADRGRVVCSGGT